jgi:hypothetical protein
VLVSQSFQFVQYEWIFRCCNFFSPLFVVDFNCPLLFRVFAMTPQYEQHKLENLPEFRVRLRSVENDSTSTYCAYCKCELYAKFTDLRNATTGKSTRNLQITVCS